METKERFIKWVIRHDSEWWFPVLAVFICFVDAILFIFLGADSLLEQENYL